MSFGALEAKESLLLFFVSFCLSGYIACFDLQEAKVKNLMSC